MFSILFKHNVLLGLNLRRCTKEVIIFLTRGIITAYQARSMSAKNAKNLGLWYPLEFIVDNP